MNTLCMQAPDDGSSIGIRIIAIAIPSDLSEILLFFGLKLLAKFAPPLNDGLSGLVQSARPVSQSASQAVCQGSQSASCSACEPLIVFLYTIIVII